MLRFMSDSSRFISSRDDDDINDVASMAGVNLSEESARILATNSELVGTVTRSCKDETFLSTSLLTRRALEIGETHKLKSKCLSFFLFFLTLKCLIKNINTLFIVIELYSTFLLLKADNV